MINNNQPVVTLRVCFLDLCEDCFVDKDNVITASNEPSLVQAVGSSHVVTQV